MTRYGMVMDLRSCIGCKACMAACSMENQTPFWDLKLEKWRTKVIPVKYNDNKLIFHSMICMHCDNPPCVPVCPTGASHIDEKNGHLVLVDYEKCINCGYCVSACPYGARYIMDEQDIQEVRVKFATTGQVHLEHTVPHVDKCTFCVHRLSDENLPEELREPACVTTCVGHVRIFGDLDDPNSEVSKLIASGKAKPLYPELGTHPRVYYIVPEGETLESTLPPAPNPVPASETELQQGIIEPLKKLAEIGAAITAGLVIASAVKSKITEKEEDEEE